jgi:hypothetical protein
MTDRALVLIPPLPRPGDHALRREEATRRQIERVANRLLYVSAYASGLVTLREGDGTVIDEPIAWAGLFPPQPGDAVVRIALPGRGDRDAAPSYVAWGPVHKADDGPGIVDREGSASGATVATNPSTTTYVNALSISIPLGPGTWEITADADLAMLHSGALRADFQVSIDGIATPRNSQNLHASIWSRWAVSRRQTNVAGNRSVTVALDYKPRDAGTVSASNPVIRVRATRLA